MRRDAAPSIPRRVNIKKSSPYEDRLPAKGVTRCASVLQYAYKLLSYRGRSEKEMFRRLKMKGFDDPVINRAIVRLKSDGLIDDMKLAYSLKRYAEETKKLSISGARRFLIERGVPVDLIDEVVGDIDETGNAKKLVEKKLASWGKPGLTHTPAKYSHEVFKRLYGMLYRRGFPSGTIKKALEQFKIKEDVG